MDYKLMIFGGIGGAFFFFAITWALMDLGNLIIYKKTTREMIKEERERNKKLNPPKLKPKKLTGYDKARAEYLKQ